MQIEFLAAIALAVVLFVAVRLLRARRGGGRNNPAQATPPAPSPTVRSQVPESAAPATETAPADEEKTASKVATKTKPKPPPALPGLEVTTTEGVPETAPVLKPMPPELREKAARKAQKKFREWAESDNWCVVEVASSDRSDRGEVEAIAVLDSKGELLLDRRLRGSGPHAGGPKAERWPDVHEEIVDTLAGFKRVLSYDAGHCTRIIGQTCARYGLDMLNKRWEGVMPAHAAHRGLWNMTTQNFQHHSLESATRDQGLVLPETEDRSPAQDGALVIALLRALAADESEASPAAAKGARG